MQKLQVGDTIRFLNTVGGGIVKGFQNKNIVIVEDDHGFDFPVLITECIVVRSEESKKQGNVKVKEQDLDTKSVTNAPQVTKIVDDEPEEVLGVQTTHGKADTTAL